MKINNCLCVYLSVPALAAPASVGTSKQRYSWVYLTLFYVWSFEKSGVRDFVPHSLKHISNSKILETVSNANFKAKAAIN